jgi:hypothetical protein
VLLYYKNSHLIQAFENSGSKFRNYKHCFSVILLGICDARYRFLAVDIGTPGRQSDSGIFKASTMGRRLENGEMQVPKPAEIFNGGPVLPYFIVGDEAFPLSSYLMRPYPGRGSGNLTYSQEIFNYRLSRARRIIENAFGILSARWRIYRRPINASEKTVSLIMKATVCLHNFILTKEGGRTHRFGKKYCSPHLLDEERNGQVIKGKRHLYESRGWCFIL